MTIAVFSLVFREIFFSNNLKNLVFSLRLYLNPSQKSLKTSNCYKIKRYPGIFSKFGFFKSRLILLSVNHNFKVWGFCLDNFLFSQGVIQWAPLNRITLAIGNLILITKLTD